MKISECCESKIDMKHARLFASLLASLLAHLTAQFLR
jgi:hypothetical protein